MLKGSELREGIGYVVTKNAKMPDDTTLKSVYKPLTRYVKNGQVYADKKCTNHVDNLEFYRDWEFTCQYPDTIEEAAKLLDAHHPNWTNKISKEINQYANEKCILGQLYGLWQTGLSTLFNIDAKSGDNWMTYGKDIIFGNQAPKEKWEEQITLRVKKEEPKMLSFTEAVKALVEGKTVKPKIWSGAKSYLKLNGTQLVDECGGHRTIFAFSDQTFTVVATTFKYLKKGDKFRKVGTPNVEYVKASTMKHGILGGYDLVEIPDETEVELVK